MIARGEDTLVDWDSRTWSYGDNMSVSGRECVENESFSRLSSPVKTGKHESMGDGFFDRVGGGRTVARVMSISRAFSGVVESNSSLVEENSNREASPFDLKLGRFPRDQIDVRGPNLSRGTPMVLPSGLSTRAKRSRAGGASSQTAYCQVYGCNKDLSSSKDYHKKHKVCEVHSKTSRVIVNGSEQRFCQQCSRFHLLSEFDDGKRSCRKRLAGHNERRRKPQVGTLSGRPGRVLQSYNGGRCQGLAFSAASFICQDLLPSGLHRSDKYGLNDLCRQVKIEEATNYCPLSAIPKTNAGRGSKSIFSYGYEKQFSNFNVNETKTATGSIFGDNTSKYHNDLQSSNSDSRSLFQETSLGNDGYNIFDAASIIRGLSGIPDSRCAFSPLSSQSQNSSSHSSGNPMAHSLVVLGNTPYSTNKYSEKLIGVSSEASFNGLSNKLPSNALGSKVRTDLCPLLISASNEVNFQIANEISQGSEFMNSKQSLSCEDGPTINLLQLSSQLQRVENQRQSVPVKQENDNFCYRQIN